jgi:hypothetical protein
VALEVEEVLALAECRAVARSIAVERRARNELEEQRSVDEKALQIIDDKARRLATRPVGGHLGGMRIE